MGVWVYGFGYGKEMERFENMFEGGLVKRRVGGCRG